MSAESQSCAARKTATDASCERRSTCWFLAITWYTKASKNRWTPTQIGEKNLFSINEYRRPSPKQLRSFGLILAAGFFVIGFGRVILRHASPVRWALALSV